MGTTGYKDCVRGSFLKHCELECQAGKVEGVNLHANYFGFEGGNHAGDFRFLNFISNKIRKRDAKAALS